MSVVAGSFEDRVPASRRRLRPAEDAASATSSRAGEVRSAATTTPVAATPSVTAASVARLRVSQQLRTGGLDQHHVAALAELEGDWPPLLVWASHPEVVLDGAHRLAAARKLGHATVKVVSFHGTADEAFVERVRRNVAHGLPLSVSDRAKAALEILQRHPDWSDRRIAEACALSPHTVARLRDSQPAAAKDDAEAADGSPTGSRAPSRRQRTGNPPAPCVSERPATMDRIIAMDSRLGKDGKSRPSQPGLLRDRVVDALKANPGGSLRQIASVAKVSPETVRRIRREFEQPGSPEISILAALRAPDEADTDWHDDPALRANRELVSWLDRTDPAGDLEAFALSVPLSRVYQLADEARRRAARWGAFAEVLEGRARARSRGYSVV